MIIKVYQHNLFKQIKKRFKKDNLEEAICSILLGKTISQNILDSYYKQTSELVIPSNCDIKFSTDTEIITDNHLALCESMFLLFNTDTRLDSKHTRSISNGDIISIDSNYYICSPIGFNKINLNFNKIKRSIRFRQYTESILKIS